MRPLSGPSSSSPSLPGPPSPSPQTLPSSYIDRGASPDAASATRRAISSSSNSWGASHEALLTSPLSAHVHSGGGSSPFSSASARSSSKRAMTDSGTRRHFRHASLAHCVHASASRRLFRGFAGSSFASSSSSPSGFGFGGACFPTIAGFALDSFNTAANPPKPLRCAFGMIAVSGRKLRSGQSSSSIPGHSTWTRFRVNQSSPPSSNATRCRHPPRLLLTSAIVPVTQFGGTFGAPPRFSCAPSGPAFAFMLTRRPTSARAFSSKSSLPFVRSTSRSIASPASAVFPLGPFGFCSPERTIGLGFASSPPFFGGRPGTISISIPWSSSHVPRNVSTSSVSSEESPPSPAFGG
mmetsp:Transcript_11775/g.42439  ORF Transcript_11775/g.42439 Transcript_11775/m.42439 type:complete len:352 (-) Transcript_11775:2050-3105(-)